VHQIPFKYVSKEQFHQLIWLSLEEKLRELALTMQNLSKCFPKEVPLFNRFDVSEKLLTSYKDANPSNMLS
jgi:hypothetical protein